MLNLFEEETEKVEEDNTSQGPFDSDDDVGLLNLFEDEHEPLLQHNASLDHLSDNKSTAKDESYNKLPSNEKGN